MVIKMPTVTLKKYKSETAESYEYFTVTNARITYDKDTACFLLASFFPDNIVVMKQEITEYNIRAFDKCFELGSLEAIEPTVGAVLYVVCWNRQTIEDCIMIWVTEDAVSVYYFIAGFNLEYHM
jgi:hypothetical protein